MSLANLQNATQGLLARKKTIEYDCEKLEYTNVERYMDDKKYAKKKKYDIRM